MEYVSELLIGILTSSFRVTKCRWPVETVFGRMKSQFRIAHHLLRNVNVPSFVDQLRIICAIINKYHPRFTPDRGHEENICQRIINRLSLENNLPDVIRAENLTRTTSHFRVYDPVEDLGVRLNDEDLYYLPTGSYMMKLINSYKARFREMNFIRKVSDVIFEVFFTYITFSSSF